MAREPYSGLPDVQQQGPAGVMERAQASPADFGAGVGQAEEGLGQTLQRTSDAVAANAVRMQEQVNDRNANQALNGYMTDAGKEMAKYDAMEGQAQHDYYPQFQQNLAALREQYGANLQSPAARLQYDNYSRFMTTRYYTAGAEKAAQGLKESYKTTASQSIDTAVGQGIMAAGNNDMPTVALQAARAADISRQTLKNIGGYTDAQAEQGAVKTRGLFYTKVLQDMAERGNVAGASQIYNTIRPTLDGESVAAIDRIMKPATDRSAGDAAANDAYNEAVGASGAGHGAPIQNPDLPDTAKKFLPALAWGEENNGYRSSAPKGDASGNPISGNRYQFLRSSWNSEAPKAGVDLNDTSPSSQDKVAWNYASNVYQTNTGRNLSADIAEGGHEAQIAQSLNKVWPSLPGGSQQNQTMAQFSQRLQQSALPTSGDAREPLTGDQIQAANDSLANNTTLNPAALDWAQRRLDIRLHALNQALQADAEHAINGIATKILQNPYSVTMTDIATNPALTGSMKFSMANELAKYQTGKSQGDGDGFSDIIGRIQAPVGDPSRINSTQDLVKLLGPGGLTFPGMGKAEKLIKDRDAPDGPALSAAMDRWKKLILFGGDTEAGASSATDESDATRAKWAQFLSVLPPLLDQSRGKMPMSDIVSDNGPIMKVIKSGNFIPTPEDVYKNAVQPAPQQGFWSKLFLGPQINPGAATSAPAATGVVGHWYIPEGASGYKEVPPGTPGARRLVAPELRARNFQVAAPETTQ